MFNLQSSKMGVVSRKKRPETTAEFGKGVSVNRAVIKKQMQPCSKPAPLSLLFIVFYFPECFVMIKYGVQKHFDF